MRVEITVPDGLSLYVVAGMDVTTGKAWPEAFFVYGSDLEEARQQALDMFRNDCYEGADEWDPEEMERAGERFQEISAELGISWDVSKAHIDGFGIKIP